MEEFISEILSEFFFLKYKECKFGNKVIDIWFAISKLFEFPTFKGESDEKVYDDCDANENREEGKLLREESANHEGNKLVRIRVWILENPYGSSSRSSSSKSSTLYMRTSTI
jgi:hypothetical protein